MKKTIMSLLLVVAMMFGILTGCAKKEEPIKESQQSEQTAMEEQSQKESQTNEETETTDQQITLTFWTPSWRQATEEPLIADFMEKYPNIKIEATYMSSEDIKANTKIAASSNTLPDMWYNWGGALADFFAENDMCLDLTEYASSNNWDERFLAGALEQCTYNGKLIGLPQNLISIVMYYRTDIFQKYNLEVPTTLEELETVCDTLVVNGVTPFSTYGNALMRTQEALMEYYGGAENHDNLLLLKESWADNEAVTKSFAKLKEWIDKGYFPKTVLTEDSSSANMLFFSGQTAMTMENPGLASQIVSNNYDVNNFSWFAFPSGTGRVSAYAKMCQFNKNISDEKLEAAMKFWEYYYSDESLEKHDTIEQPTATIGVELPEKYALADGMLELIEKNGSYSVMDLKVVPEVMAQYFAVSDGVILGSVAPENAGAEIQAAIDSYLANQ